MYFSLNCALFFILASYGVRICVSGAMCAALSPSKFTHIFVFDLMQIKFILEILSIINKMRFSIEFWISRFASTVKFNFETICLA